MGRELAACAANEALTEVVIEFTKPSMSGGDDVVYQSVRLTNASFSQIARFTDPADGTADTSDTFQIRSADIDSKTDFADTWSTSA